MKDIQPVWKVSQARCVLYVRIMLTYGRYHLIGCLVMEIVNLLSLCVYLKRYLCMIREVSTILKMSTHRMAYYIQVGCIDHSNTT